jgi:integrase
MAKSDDPDRYLLKRNGWYHYQRSVPLKIRGFYDGPLVRCSLQTQSFERAREQRDALAKADDEYWHSLKEKLRLEAAGHAMDIEPATKRYELAKVRALSAGFRYKPLHELADPSLIEELVRRSLAVGEQSTADGRVVPEVADAMLGGVEEPKVPVSEAMKIYQTKIVVGELANKSPAQKKLWKATKDRSLAYFIDCKGDIAITDISREDAQDYFNWWNDQIAPNDPDVKPKSPKTAARHFGDMRDLYTKYFAYMGDEKRENPFRNLNFKTRKTKQRKYPPFSNAWVREKILVRQALEGLTPDLQLTAYMLIETGCRHGEIINLRPEDIRLNANVPHIRIAERDDREFKTDEATLREIPLVGVALEAARRAPGGFPRYHDKSNSFSAALGAAFNRRGLFETPRHVIYSFRHSFEDRMKEAGIDFELRCLLMGHDNKRPEYGTGGSLEYRRNELMKIAHPYPDDLFATFDAAQIAA